MEIVKLDIETPTPLGPPRPRLGIQPLFGDELAFSFGGRMWAHPRTAAGY